MIERLRTSRSLRLAIVALVAPIIVVTSSPAQAEVIERNFSAWATAAVTVKPGSLFGQSIYGDVNCAVSIGREITTQSIFAQGSCQGGMDLSPAFAQYGEQGGPGRVWVEGSGCESKRSSFILSPSEHDASWRIAGTIPLHSLDEPGSCMPAQVCIQLKPEDAKWWPGDDSSEGRFACGPAALSAGDSRCRYGQVYQPVVHPEVKYGVYAERRTPKKYVTFLHALTDDEPDWAFYGVFRVKSTLDVSAGGMGYSNNVPNRAKPGEMLITQHKIAPLNELPSVMRFPVAAQRPNRPELSEYEFSFTGPFERELIGVGVLRRSGPFNAVTTTYAPSPTSAQNGGIGRHDPSTCHFYWGEKVWDDGQPFGPDEPAHGLDQAPVIPGQDAPIDEIPVDDAPSESMWWSALWGVLKELARSIMGIPGAILDGLNALFTAPAGLLQSQIKSLTDGFKSSNAGDWEDMFAGVFAGRASSPMRAGSPEGGAAHSAMRSPGHTADWGSGCSGPGVDLSGILPEDVTVAGLPDGEMHPFQACEGMAVELAHWSRLLITIIVGIGAGVKIFEYIGRSAGAIQQNQILLSHDWSSAHVRSW